MDFKRIKITGRRMSGYPSIQIDAKSLAGCKYFNDDERIVRYEENSIPSSARTKIRISHLHIEMMHKELSNEVIESGLFSFFRNEEGKTDGQRYETLYRTIQALTGHSVYRHTNSVEFWEMRDIISKARGLDEVCSWLHNEPFDDVVGVDYETRIYRLAGANTFIFREGKDEIVSLEGVRVSPKVTRQLKKCDCCGRSIYFERSYTESGRDSYSVTGDGTYCFECVETFDNCTNCGETIMEGNNESETCRRCDNERRTGVLSYAHTLRGGYKFYTRSPFGN